MTILPSVVIKIGAIWLTCLLAACGPGLSSRCNGDSFENLDESQQLACLESGYMDTPSGHAALGAAQIHLLRYARDGTVQHAERYVVQSRVAKSGAFANESLRADSLVLLRYHDAFLSMSSGQKIDLGADWLDTVCPETDRGERFRCHVENLAYWATQADDGSRFENEALYLAFRGLHRKFGEPAYKGVELAALGFYDLPAAQAEFNELQTSERMEAAIAAGYCAMLRRRDPDAVTTAALVEASCP